MAATCAFVLPGYKTRVHTDCSLLPAATIVSAFAQENRPDAMLVAARWNMDLVDRAANGTAIRFSLDRRADGRCLGKILLPTLDVVAAILRHHQDVVGDHPGAFPATACAARASSPQAAISAIVRPHPMQRWVRGSRMQTLMQGEGLLAPDGGCMALILPERPSDGRGMVPTRGFEPRTY